MSKEYDLNQMTEILKQLREGWSVTVAVKRAGVTVKEYKYLKDTYPSFKASMEMHYQNSGSTPWVKP